MELNKAVEKDTAGNKNGKSRVTNSGIALVSIISVTYLLLAAWFLGLKAEHIGLVIVFNILFYLSSSTRKFILGFSIFISFSVLYDFMKAFPNYEYAQVNIANLYLLEKSLFGIQVNHLIVTPNEYLLQHRSVFLDVLSGLFYLTWIPVPLLFSFYLFIRRRQQFLYFFASFFLINIIGFIIYYLFPAAPPWYVQQYGFNFFPHVASNEAGLIRFDNYFNISLFRSIYSKGSNVFAALPSLHCAYPLVVFYFGIKNRLGLINILFATLMVGIWFAAVYTSHHYVIDVLLGIACGLCGLVLFEKVLIKTRLVQDFLKRYEKVIS